MAKSRKKAVPAAEKVEPAPRFTNAPMIDKEKNTSDLKRATKYAGFGESLDKEIDQKMAALKPGDKHFAIESHKHYMKPGSKADDLSTQAKVTYTLNYERGKDDAMHLNNYKAELAQLVKLPEGGMAMQTREQNFYINRSGTITAKEAYNLLDGRAVYKKDVTNKAGEKYNTWIQLDFENLKDGKAQKKTFNDQYGYDVAKAVDQLPILEKKNENSRKFLIDGLLKGDLRPVTFEGQKTEGGSGEEGKQGKTIKTNGFAAAAPQWKNVQTYNEDGTKRFQKKAIGMKV